MRDKDCSIEWNGLRAEGYYKNTVNLYLTYSQLEGPAVSLQGLIQVPATCFKKKYSG